ncbi:glycoside hydrolase domain-containing protein [Alloscardovia venturai]|uniref:Glycoside hydrolase domain-containing protein n=1 Tax=Alloscardovia venturai TaxID=1769421 RepID=A0ABW2Y987_9BIFI
MTDTMVLATQKWLNETYKGKQGFTAIKENGQTGWDTIYALLHALQIELGISATADNFGEGTQSRFRQKWPNGIHEQSSESKMTDNVYGIIQGALWCKGYSTSSGEITTHFFGGTGGAIRELKADMGIGGDSTVTLAIMMSLLSMDQFKLLENQGANSSVRSIQQKINQSYRNYTGIIPTDGLYGRQMNTALIQVLQSLEGYSPHDATGNFGAGTTSHLRTVTPSNYAPIAQWVWLATAALACNGYDLSPTTVWSGTVTTVVRKFQSDYALPVTGVVDKTTWMSLLTSCGDPNRAAKACDCATVLNAQQAKDLRSSGYTHVGRYLTGTVGVGSNRKSKAMNLDEVKNIQNAGLAVFPIYQDGGYYPEYFASPRQGAVDGYTAIDAAQRLGFPQDTIIYFAVDFDAYGYQIEDMIVPYFEQVCIAFANKKTNTKSYRVGVYGPRLVCREVSRRDYAIASFVADMSRGFAGNLGYAIPENWSFDQFYEGEISSAPSFALDKDAYSGRDKGVKSFDHVTQISPADIEKANVKRDIQIAQDMYVRNVLEPLNCVSKQIKFSWSYNERIKANHITTPNYDLDVELYIAESTSLAQARNPLIHISVNNYGSLSASTKNEISSASGKFDLQGFDAKGKYTDILTKIATSVKSGSVDCTVAVNNSGQLIADFTVSSRNLAPESSGLEEYVSVSVSYILTLHPVEGRNYMFKEPDMDTAKTVIAILISAVALGVAVMEAALEALLTLGVVIMI